MKTLAYFTCAVLLLFGLSGAAGATIINGDFETGDLTGWTVDAVGDGDVFAGLVDGDYAAIELTSASISQGFSWNIGDIVTFEWKWDYSDWGSPYNDTIYWGVTDTSGTYSFTQTLAGYSDVGWTTTTYEFLTAGSGSIFFGVDDGFDEFVNSYGYFDNISATPTPEPSTMLLFGVGLLGIAGIGRRKK